MLRTFIAKPLAIVHVHPPSLSSHCRIHHAATNVNFRRLTNSKNRVSFTGITFGIWRGGALRGAGVAFFEDEAAFSPSLGG